MATSVGKRVHEPPQIKVEYGDEGEEWVTGTLTHWTKGNNGSCNSHPYFVREFYLTGRGGSFSYPIQVGHSVALAHVMFTRGSLVGAIDLGRRLNVLSEARSELFKLTQAKNRSAIRLQSVSNSFLSDPKPMLFTTEPPRYSVFIFVGLSIKIKNIPILENIDA
ncbi:hypothetical protein EVAR_65038_1 [Eumeta japonica]|uniref:Uncharacterized protein n=1 Tax=Eumeta variegata TaxID=151549 RepID=A0A4C1YTW6_EUMVA|nr:hypothetical protein EVAR_65038_1 [Eumeta japonica]